MNTAKDQTSVVLSVLQMVQDDKTIKSATIEWKFLDTGDEIADILPVIRIARV